MTPNPTLSLKQAASQIWDVLVVGAGVAGAFAARLAARQGLRVLLADKSAFPRHKVCGGCLNAAALGQLKDAGLGGLPLGLGGRPFAQARLAVAGRLACVALPAAIAVSRERWDAALVAEAMLAGAQFLPEAEAILENRDHDVWCVAVNTTAEGRGNLKTRLVIAAGGLSGTFFKRQAHFVSQVERRSRVGIGTVLESSDENYEAGALVMALARGGYAGVVRAEGNRTLVAAACDPTFLRDAGGPAAAAAAIFREAGLPPIKAMRNARWMGTPLLARRRHPLAAPRFFIIGDAAGYVEPFTGEGMAWALASAAAAASLAEQAVFAWQPSLVQAWAQRHRALLASRQRACAGLAKLLRRPFLTEAIVRVLAQAPALATPVIRRLNRPFAIARKHAL